MAAQVIELVTRSVASDSCARQSTALRDALAASALRAAKRRAKTDMCLAQAVAGIGVLIEMACSDEFALELLGDVSQVLRDEIAGATTDARVIAAVELAAQGGNQQ